MLNFRCQRRKFNEFEHSLLNHFRPFDNKITDENKIHFCQSLLRDECLGIIPQGSRQRRLEGSSQVKVERCEIRSSQRDIWGILENPQENCETGLRQRGRKPHPHVLVYQITGGHTTRFVNGKQRGLHN